MDIRSLIATVQQCAIDIRVCAENLPAVYGHFAEECNLQRCTTENSIAVFDQDLKELERATSTLRVIYNRKVK